MTQKIIDEGEMLALIHHYGGMISRVGGGLAGSSRADVIEWARRVSALAESMRGKNSAYLADEE